MQPDAVAQTDLERLREIGDRLAKRDNPVTLLNLAVDPRHARLADIKNSDSPAAKPALLIDDLNGHGGGPYLVYMDGSEPRVVQPEQPVSLSGWSYIRSAFTAPVLSRYKPLPPPPPPPERFKLTWFDDVDIDQRKEWLVKDAFGKGEFTVVSGKPGSGKSVIMTDLAAHVAAGLEWHGRRVDRGLVVYIAAERVDLTKRRLVAFRKRHGVSNVPLLVLGGALDFTRDTVDAAAVIGAVKQAEAERGIPCRWIIVDTLTRVFGGGDQNTSKDMGRLVKSCDMIMQGTGAHVTVIHHTGWESDRGKGAIDLDGAVDASFIVSKESGTLYCLRCDGANDGPEGLVTAFGMEGVQIGIDEDGVPTTAPVVVPREPAQKPVQSGGPKGYTATALAALESVVSGHGVEPEGDHFPAGVCVVTEDQWRQAFYDSDTTADLEALKKRFQRARNNLETAGATGHVGQWYWPKGGTSDT